MARRGADAGQFRFRDALRRQHPERGRGLDTPEQRLATRQRARYARTRPGRRKKNPGAWPGLWNESVEIAYSTKSGVALTSTSLPWTSHTRTAKQKLKRASMLFQEYRNPFPEVAPPRSAKWGRKQALPPRWLEARRTLVGECWVHSFRVPQYKPRLHCHYRNHRRIRHKCDSRLPLPSSLPGIDNRPLDRK